MQNFPCVFFFPHMCLTMELLYHGIYFGIKILWNMLWENSDIMISFFLLEIFL